MFRAWYCGGTRDDLLSYLSILPTTPPWVRAQGPVGKVNYQLLWKDTGSFKTGRLGDGVQNVIQNFIVKNKHKVWDNREINMKGAQL